jgi:quercetin 2,3-dioxygenase
VRVAGNELPVGAGARLRPGVAVEIDNGELESELLLLQGRPIGEPVVARGPFVMNTEQEIAEAYRDYRRDEFGGWPWPNSAPVHPRDQRHFAVHADGRKESAS